MFDLWESGHFTNHLSQQKRMKTFTTQNSVKKKSTRSQHIASPGVNNQRSHLIKKNTKCNISSPIRNDRNSCAKHMDFVIYVFHDFHMINKTQDISKSHEISISTTWASDKSRSKISNPLPYPGRLIFAKSWREKLHFHFSMFLKIRGT